MAEETISSEEEAVPQTMPNLLQGLLGAFGVQDPDDMGRQVGNLFADMKRRIDEPVEPGTNPVAHIFGGLFGPEIAARLAREVEIKEFFMARLTEGSMPEAIRITKEQFQLPDNYSIQVPLTVDFKITGTKVAEPSID